MTTPNPPPARACAKLTPDEQREHIVGMMLRREWNPGVSHKQLAEDWGIGVRQVSERALQASRAIQIAGNVKDWVGSAVAELDAMQAMALAEEKVVCTGRDEKTKTMMFERVPQPNIKAAAYCIELKAKMLGALAPVKTQAVEPDDIDKMSPAEKIAAHEKAIADLRAEQAGETRH